VDIQTLKHKTPTSPAFVVDEIELLKALQALSILREQSGCKVLYSIKSLPLTVVMALAKPYVEGFSVSSLFEARLANEILAGQGSIHLTTPGIRPDEIAELVSVCSHISCNSISQYRRVKLENQEKTSIGLRVNPKISFSDDARYDPCRQFSKLGVDVNELVNGDIINTIKGLHFHTVFAATEYTALFQTLTKLRSLMGDKFEALEWLNFGGGYFYGQIADNEGFSQVVTQLRDEFGVDIYIEPGNAIVGKAGYLLSTVIDCFNSDGKAIAVLDTSVNHHPEVFEFQRQPELVGHDPTGRYSALLAGSTCLAGDLFGEYRFNQPLQVGERLVFKHVGAYSLVKANRFNGYNLPDVYIADEDQIKRIKQYSYQDYRQQWLGDIK
jgi:carboxynorspermidine decarboxylase